MFEKLIDYINLKLELLEEDMDFYLTVLDVQEMWFKLNIERKTLQHILDKIQELKDEQSL